MIKLKSIGYSFRALIQQVRKNRRMSRINGRRGFKQCSSYAAHTGKRCILKTCHWGKHKSWVGDRW